MNPTLQMVSERSPGKILQRLVESRFLHKALLLVALCSYIAAFYPGAWTADPIWALMQIRGIDPVNNWHPPIITLIWHGLWTVFQHHGMLWLVQTLLYLGAAYLISTSIRQVWLSLAVLGSILFLPPLMANFAIFWKDNWYLIFGLLSFGFLLRFQRRRDVLNGSLAVAFALLFFSTRYNAFVAAAPLFFGICWVWSEVLVPAASRWRRPWARVGLVLLGCLTLALATSAINRVVAAVYVKKQYQSWQIIPLYDLTGISVRSRELVLPQYILQSQEYRPRLEQLDAIYNETTSDALVWTDGSHYSFPVPNETLELVQSKEQLSDILSTWFRGMLTHPREYFFHRRGLFINHLGLKRAEVHAPYTSGIIPNRFGWTFEATSATHAFYRFVDPIAHGLLFRGYFYLVLSLLLLGICLWQRTSLVTWCLVASGFLTFVGNFFLLAAADFRYLLWAVLICVIAPGILLSEVLARRTPQLDRV